MSISPAIPLANYVSRVPINISTNGTNHIVAGSAGNKVKVIQMLLMSAADVNLTFKDTAGNSLSGPLPMGVKGNGFCLYEGMVSWFETATGAGLDIALDGAVQVSGVLVYLQVP